MGDLLQFVDTIAASPTVRLDLNDDTTWGLEYDGTDFSPPPLRQAWAGSLLADGQKLTAAAFDNRRIQLALELKTASVDTSATQLQALWRELNRPTNFLKWQPTGASSPLFFKTWRSSDNTVTEYPGPGNYRGVQVSIVAEPFAYGLKETLGGTLNANPFFETNVANWSLANHGTATFVRSTAQFHEGVASGLLTPDGVAASPEVRCENVPVTAGIAYRVSVWVRCAAARTITVGIIWRDSAGVFMSSSTVGVAVAANTWTLLQTAAVAPALTAFANLTVQMGGTPPGSALLHIDEATIAQSFVVNNDPAATVNGMFFEAIGVKGDVETPLLMKLDGAAPPGSPWQPVIAVRRRGTPSAAPFVLQSASFTRGGDTTLQPGPDAAMSGSFTRSTFAGSNLKLTIEPWPAAASVDNRGRYRVFARVRKSSASDAIAVWMSYGSSQLLMTAVVNTKAVLNNITDPQYVDLGELQIPFGQDPVTDGQTGTQIPASGLYLGVSAERTSGAGTLDIDLLLFMPADDRLLISTWSSFLAPAGWIFDGDKNVAYAVGASGETQPGIVEKTTGFPMVSPGVTNRVFLMNHTGAKGTFGDVLTKTTTVTASYNPHYLYVRPATT